MPDGLHTRSGGDQHQRLSASTAGAAPEAAERIRKFYEEMAIPADSFARAVAFAVSQPEDVDVNEIVFRPTSQEL
jgi:NADP-dependent 3-hydroxy acid dehydrogenase YdfG